MKLKAIVVVVAGIIVTMSPARALAYDCSIGGEQVATTHIFLYGSDHTGAAVDLRGKTTRSVEDRNQCPGWVRVEGWIDGDPNGAIHRKASHIRNWGIREI